jgi:hypothetical protein
LPNRHILTIFFMFVACGLIVPAYFAYNSVALEDATSSSYEDNVERLRDDDARPAEKSIDHGLIHTNSYMLLAELVSFMALMMSVGSSLGRPRQGYRPSLVLRDSQATGPPCP